MPVVNLKLGGVRCRKYRLCMVVAQQITITMFRPPKFSVSKIDFEAFYVRLNGVMVSRCLFQGMMTHMTATGTRINDACWEQQRTTTAHFQLSGETGLMNTELRENLFVFSFSNRQFHGPSYLDISIISIV